MLSLNFVFYPKPSPPGYDKYLEGLFYVKHIPCMLIEKQSQVSVIFFHGNAEDLGYSVPFVSQLADELQLTFISMEYPSYGLYETKGPSQKSIEDDTDILMDYLLNEKNIKLENIILFGRSLGTGPACYLAQKYKQLKALILMSAYTSLRDVACDKSLGIAKYLLKEQFSNLERAQDIVCPTLLIHGKNDTLIAPSHSQQIFQKLGSQEKSIQTPPHMTHNEFDMQFHIINPIKSFLHKHRGNQSYINQLHGDYQENLIFNL